MHTYYDIEPGRKPFKKATIQTAMFAMGRAWQTLYRFDQRLRQEVAEWPEGFRLMFKVRPHGPQWVMEKDAAGRVRYRGGRGAESDVDLVIYFKNVECAFLVFTAQMGVAQAYAEHRMSVKGDLRYGLSVVRSMNVVETYLFPHPIARQTIKRPVPIPAVKKHACRLWVYLMGIPLGL